MITRILPRSEWSRLDGTDIGRALPYHNADDVQIVVVEDESKIVGTWCVLRVVQLEGVWIHPDYRKTASVARRLMTKTLELARKLAPAFAYTGSQTDEVAALLTDHLNAVKVPMDTYIVPLRELVPCP